MIPTAPFSLFSAFWVVISLLCSSFFGSHVTHASRTEEEKKEEITKIRQGVISSSSYVTTRHFSPPSCTPHEIEVLSAMNIPNLQSINLRRCAIDQSHIRALNKGLWDDLEHLDLGDNGIGNEEIRIFSQGSWSALRYLSLSSNRISAPGMEALCRCPLPRLRSLILDDNQLSDPGLAALSKGSWCNLWTLSVEQNQISDEGANEFAKGRWPRLQEFRLALNGIGNEGAAALALSLCAELVDLNLFSNQIGLTGAKRLLWRGSWSKLRHLNLRNNECDLIERKLPFRPRSGHRVHLTMTWDSLSGEIEASEIAHTTLKETPEN